MSQLLSYAVIIPVYNAAKTLRGTINSVLKQTYMPEEIILIDDCSTDQSWKILENFSLQYKQIKIYRNSQNLGVAKTRNFGFSQCTTKYIALLDSDDLWEPKKMETQITLMQRTNCDFCYTSYRFMDSNSNLLKKIYFVPTQLTFQKMLRENVIGCSSVVLKRSIAKSYLMTDQYLHEDYVYWLQLLKAGKSAFGIVEPLMIYRLCTNSRSSNKLNAAKERFKIYRQELGLNIFASCYYFTRYVLSGIYKHYFT